MESITRKHPVKNPISPPEKRGELFDGNRVPIPVHRIKSSRYIRIPSESSMLLSDREASTVAAA